MHSDGNRRWVLLTFGDIESQLSGSVVDTKSFTKFNNPQINATADVYVRRI